MSERDTTGKGGQDRDRPDRAAEFDPLSTEARDRMGHGFDAQGRIRSLLEQRTHRAAEQLGGVADVLHKAAGQLNDENNGTAARYADQAADRVGRVAEMLRDSTVDDMVNEVERFARRQPEIFVGAAFAIGFLTARFVKSGGGRRDEPASKHPTSLTFARSRPASRTPTATLDSDPPGIGNPRETRP